MRRFLSAIVFILPLASCNDTSLNGPAPAPATITVTFAKEQLVIGESTTATAVLRDDNYQIMPAQKIEWSSFSPSTATVSDEGVITAVLSGGVRIMARVGNTKGTATLFVVLPPPKAVASLELTIAADSLVNFGETRVRAVVRDVSGAIVTRQLQWTSTNPTVASVSSTGYVRAPIAGSATIIATIEGKADSVTVVIPPVARIRPYGETRMRVGIVQAVRAETFITGDQLVPRQVTWTSVDPTRGTVTPGGQFTPLVNGPITLLATADDASATHVVNGYGWVLQQAATTVVATVQSADPTSQGFATLSVGCENGTPFMRIGLPFTASGKVLTSPNAWDFVQSQWPVTATGVTIPTASTDDFRVTLQSISLHNMWLYVERAGASLEELYFQAHDVYAALAPAVAACPALAP